MRGLVHRTVIVDPAGVEGFVLGGVRERSRVIDGRADTGVHFVRKDGPAPTGIL